MPRSRSRSRSYSRSVSTSRSSHRDRKYARSHKSSSRYKSSSRKRSRERDRHRKSSHSKHSKHYSSRRHSSSRSRSSSRDSRNSSTSTSSGSTVSSTDKSRRRSKETKEVPNVVAPPVAPAVEKVPNFASVEQLGSNISAKVFQELNEDSFTAKAFTSSGTSGGGGVKKSPSSSILIDITSNPTIQLPKPAITELPEDTVFHQNLYGNDATRMEKWVKKLFAYRQKIAGRM